MIKKTNGQSSHGAIYLLPQKAIYLFLMSLLFIISFSMKGETKNESNDEDLIKKYIDAKGYGSFIVFNSSNIKQFWVDKSVLSYKDKFDISLQKNKTKWESVPLFFQLANVDETLNCKIDVITEDKNVSFSVFDKKGKIISSSSFQDDFVSYSIVSSEFHLEDSCGLSFNIVFLSDTSDTISIKKIVMSFSENNDSSFLKTPGHLIVFGNDITVQEQTDKIKPTINDMNKDGFTVTGKRSQIFSKKNILISDNTLHTNVKIKNIGNHPITIYVGYAVYSKDHILLQNQNYPYASKNEILHVLSIDEEGTKITVDSFPEWSKYCFLALNAKDDFSDVPSTSFARGKIDNIIKLTNGKAEITVDKPIKNDLKEGDTIRIHRTQGGYLYMNTKKIQPGEESVFDSSIKKDDEFYFYSSKAFSKGVYFVKPLILLYSDDPNEYNTILIENYSIEY